MTLAGLDLAGIYREVFETAVCMGRGVLSALGVASEEVERVEHEYRERDQARLDSQTESGDLHASKQLMYRPEEETEEQPG
jgi:hypothetical protein